ncbi:uncharacterized protein LOC120801051 isoform X2 [Xiphias gladius]|uniref:uncharacterized protein LOC120801051 isoform X2 n=1 Tax=Xiphias gladius TaxID=8245 RepID=UPI001A99A19B|nr:uncharacterized protein LOC120801051 isoform X2 [Xiphias gladius]
MAQWYFLACGILTSCLVSGQPQTYGLPGQTFHLKPHVTGQPDHILWKHNRDKVVEFNGREEQVYDRFHNRVTLDWVSAELNITDLRYEDSGEFELEAFIMNKDVHHSHYKLKVIDKVAKPTISCEVNNGNSTVNGTQATLMCSADPTHPQSSMKFEWGSGGNPQPGAELTISLEDEHDDKKYTCRVSNPLTVETATFTAKDCFSDESPKSVALAASLATTILIGLLLLVLGVVFCKQNSKACFAERSKGDLEKQLPPDKTEESDKETAEDEECRPFLDRAATLPCPQRLGHLNQERSTDKDEKTVSPPSPLGRKPSFCQDPDNLPSNDKGDADADADQSRGRTEEKVPECDCSDSEKANEPDPAGVLDCTEDTQSDVEPATAPAQPESEKALDENEEAKSPPANGILSPTAQPCSPLTQNSTDMGTKDTAGGHREDAKSDQANGEISEKKSRESDSPVSEERNVSVDSSEERQLSTVPEQNSSEAALHEQD